LKIKAQRLRIGSIIAVLIGILLLIVIGPAITNTGIVSDSGDHGWYFFKTYSWLIGSEPLTGEVTAMYWVGISISIIGLFVFAAGLTI
jgi:Ca2+/Na+ antiporter